MYGDIDVAAPSYSSSIFSKRAPVSRQRRQASTWLVAGVLAAGLALAWVAPAARADSVVTWGQGVVGTGPSSTPMPVSGLSSGVTAIAAGAYHSLAIQNGAAYAWGNNLDGQLGNGTKTSTNSGTPVAVIGMSSGVTAVAGGYMHSLANQNGAVYAWGDNHYGQLGNGTYTFYNATPVAVTGLSSGVTAIAAGQDFSLAIQNGGLYAWGLNSNGQLGDGTQLVRNTPVAVSGLSSGVTAIAAGANFNLAVQNGGVYAWGENGFGKLGNGTFTGSKVPVAVKGLTSGVTAVAAGAEFSLAVQSGSVYAWGYDGYGQLGTGAPLTNSTTPIQVDPTDLTNIISVAAAYDSGYALSSDGSLWVWGNDYEGQSGLGTTGGARPYPSHLLPPNGYRFTSIDADADGYYALATIAPVPEPRTAFVGAMILLVGLATARKRHDLDDNIA